LQKTERRAAGQGRVTEVVDVRGQLVEDIFRASAALHEQSARRSGDSIVAAAEALKKTFAAGGQLLVFGNGGSALDAQHFASELVGRFSRERRALAAIALTTDTSIITSVANDYSYDKVFTRQIEALGRRGDVAWGISTSGTSRNVLDALTFARARGLSTVALTGRDGGTIGAAADLHLNVPHHVTARIQEVHRTLIHAVCELVEMDL
jgi:D-sedoheptulose 7-phosphate isomerase